MLLASESSIICTSLCLSDSFPACRRCFRAAEDAWRVITPTSINDRDMTCLIETEQRHALEVERKDLLAVHDLESKLALSQRWTPDDPQWKEAEIMAGKRTYQRCLDTLEGLVISRMFELTKMNMSQTGRYSRVTALTQA